MITFKDIFQSTSARFSLLAWSLLSALLERSFLSPSHKKNPSLYFVKSHGVWPPTYVLVSRIASDGLVNSHFPYSMYVRIACVSNSKYTDGELLSSDAENKKPASVPQSYQLTCRSGFFLLLFL